jgi:CBS domain-containing protein
MEQHGIRRLPVLSEGQLVGMLTRADFVRALRRFVTPTLKKAIVADEEIKHRISAESPTRNVSLHSGTGPASA